MNKGLYFICIMFFGSVYSFVNIFIEIYIKLDLCTVISSKK